MTAVEGNENNEAVQAAGPLVESADNRSVPLWAWTNVLSLDAVSIGVLWQTVFVVQYCGRFPLWFEHAIVGIAIWLVYTADRMLDSAKLDPTKMHTFRHGFHHRNRGIIGIVWLCLFMINAYLTIKFPSEIQLRWGVAMVALVTSYLVVVQWFSSMRRWIPKELIAGMLFAFGVILVPCSETSSSTPWSLLLSWTLAASLFSTNCALVAFREIDLDCEQSFQSLATRFQGIGFLLGVSLAAQWLIVCGLLLTGQVPRLIGGCIVVCVSGLLLETTILQSVFRWVPTHQTWKRRTCREHAIGLRVLGTDLATILGPAVTLIWIGD